MAQRILIKVTIEDIKNGIRDSLDECPVSLAITRNLGYSIDLRDIFHIHDFRGPFPPVVDWIAEFDLGNRVEPFSFVLELDN